MFQAIIDAFLTGSNYINSAMESNDTIVGPRKVLRAVNKAEAVCVLLLHWEMEVASIESPQEYSHLKKMIAGLTEPTFDTLCEFPEDLTRLNQKHKSVGHHTLSMDLESPENMAEFKRKSRG